MIKKDVKYFSHYKIEDFNIGSFKVLQYTRNLTNGKKTIRLFNQIIDYKTKKHEYTGPVLYFKVNNIHHMTMECIQQCVNVAHILNSNFYFVCDKIQIEEKIRKSIKFYFDDIKFIPSAINDTTKEIIDLSIVKSWKKAAYAHLTPFYQAKENNINEFWNIDADDTYFFCNENKIAEIILKVLQEAKNQKASCISLDMHSSKMNNKHWSFGVTYIQNIGNIFELLKKTCSKNWKEGYDIEENANLDWFFTYLRDKNILNLKVFYVENLFFAHVSYLNSPYNVAAINYWNNNKFFLPNMWVVDKNFSLPIPKDFIRIDANLKQESQIIFEDFIISPKIKEEAILKYQR